MATEDNTWAEASMTVNQMRRSLVSHKQWFKSFSQQVERHANLYAGTGMKSASAAMQETMVKHSVQRGPFYWQHTRFDPQ